jgi:hypothetical protein
MGLEQLKSLQLGFMVIAPTSEKLRKIMKNCVSANLSQADKDAVMADGVVDDIGRRFARKSNKAEELLKV